MSPCFATNLQWKLMCLLHQRKFHKQTIAGVKQNKWYEKFGKALIYLWNTAAEYDAYAH